MAIIKTPQNQQNIYTHQQRPKQPATKTRNVWQDKGAFHNARAEAREPDPLANGSRAHLVNRNTPRSQTGNPVRIKLIHTTIHIHPLVRGELERKARDAGVSISAIGAQALYDWAFSNVERQHASTLKTELRQMVREELAAFGHRIVFFLMRIAFSAEQARILVTNTLKLVLTLSGQDQKTYYTLVDESAKLAKRNIIKKTPQLSSLLDEWERFTAKGRGEEATS